MVKGLFKSFTLSMNNSNTALFIFSFHLGKVMLEAVYWHMQINSFRVKCVCVFAHILSGLVVLDMISVFIDGCACILSLSLTRSPTLSLFLLASCLVVSVGFVNVRARVCLQCRLVI